jgi:hypothetical protein
VYRCPASTNRESSPASGSNGKRDAHLRVSFPLPIGGEAGDRDLCRHQLHGHRHRPLFRYRSGRTAVIEGVTALAVDASLDAGLAVRPLSAAN